MNPIDSPDLYDVVDIGGAQTPGLAEIVGAEDKRKWDKQEGKGQTGGTAKFGGKELAEFEVVLSFWHRSHFERWTSFRAVLKAPSGENAKSLSIYHPILAELEISSVNVVSVSQIKRVDETGLWQVTIKLMQAAPAKPASAVPRGTGAAATGHFKIEPLIDPYVNVSGIAGGLNRTQRDDALGALSGGPPPTADEEGESMIGAMLQQFAGLGKG